MSGQLKHEMRLQNNDKKPTCRFLDTNWTAQCDKMMAEDSQLLLQFGKFKSGEKLVFGNKGYLLNPFQVICPIYMEIKAGQKSEVKSEVSPEGLRALGTTIFSHILPLQYSCILAFF